MNILVTGGAGLIGSHIVDLLIKKGHDVRILDNLELPTHLKGKPAYIPKEAEFIYGDVRDYKTLEKALAGVEVVFHQAATGGFTSEIEKYIEINSLGTARILEVIKKNKIDIKKFIVASSVGIYGEGKYSCKTHGIINSKLYRSLQQFKLRKWELKCPFCNDDLNPVLTDETTPVDPSSAYSISKYDQERLVMTFGKDYDIPVVALRYFLTYGPRQSIHNPYTGVCSIFSMRILNNKPVIVYEDGKQTRDFIFVKDVAEANLLVMEKDEANHQVFNVGTGISTTIKDLALSLSELYNKDINIETNSAFRLGDARHVVADISRLKKLGFKPQYTLKEGLQEYINWIRQFGNIKDYFLDAIPQLETENIVRKI